MYITGTVYNWAIGLTPQEARVEAKRDVTVRWIPSGHEGDDGRWCVYVHIYLTATVHHSIGNTASV